MDFTWSDADRARYRQARTLGSTLGTDVAQREVAGTFCTESWQKAAASGLLGGIVPASLGGQGLTLPSAVRQLEGLARGCRDGGLMMAMHAHIWGAMSPVLDFATPEQQARWLPPMCAGAHLGALAMTEPDTGSAAFSLTTTARREGEHYVLSGEKAWITNGPRADAVIAIARTGEGPAMQALSCFYVAGDNPGLLRGVDQPRMGLTTCDIGPLTFTDCRVPLEDRIGAEGAGAQIFLSAMTWERIGIMASALGTMEAQLEVARRHARARRPDGRPIGAHQAVSHRIAEMKVRLESSRLMVYHAASVKQQGKMAGLPAAMAKLSASEAFVDSALSTIRVLGAEGLRADRDAPRQLRDAVCSLIYSGTSDIQRNLIAGMLGVG